MATIINRTTMELMGSAHFVPHVSVSKQGRYKSSDWMLVEKDDVSAALAIPMKYRKISGSSVTTISTSQKNTVDNATNKAQKLAELQQATAIISDELEDIYNAMNSTDRGKVATATKDKIADKKTKRDAYNNA